MKEQKVTTQEEAIEFLKKYTDDEVYTHKCITSHNMAIAALEKQIPEKPFCDTIYRQISFITVEKEDIFTCKCNNTVCKEYRYCPFCGQKLDWSDL